jgi:hypothetical protein
MKPASTPALSGGNHFTATHGLWLTDDLQRNGGLTSWCILGFASAITGNLTAASFGTTKKPDLSGFSDTR